MSGEKFSMIEQSLITTLAETLSILDNLEMQDAQAVSFERSQQRIAVLLPSIQRLHQSLRRLRAAALLLQVAAPGHYMVHHWDRTRSDLRARMPPDFRAPAQAIIEGHLDLLRLLEYTASSSEIARERGSQIVECLGQLLQNGILPDSAQCDCSPETSTSRIEESLALLAGEATFDNAQKIWCSLRRGL